MLSAGENNAFDDAYYGWTRRLSSLRKINFMEERR
jgi:hypothetical protein